MYKIIFVIIISFLNIRCSKPAREVSEFYVNSELSPYFEMFKQEAAKRSHSLNSENIIIDFGDTFSSKTFGRCNTKFKKDESNPLDPIYQATPNVVISKDWWNLFSEDELNGSDGEIKKIELIFHELGHCLLWKEHNSKKNKFKQIPESLMYPYLITEQNETFRNFIRTNKETYFDQLFGLVELAATYAISLDPFGKLNFKRSFELNAANFYEEKNDDIFCDWHK